MATGGLNDRTETGQPCWAPASRVKSVSMSDTLEVQSRGCRLQASRPGSVSPASVPRCTPPWPGALDWGCALGAPHGLSRPDLQGPCWVVPVSCIFRDSGKCWSVVTPGHLGGVSAVSCPLCAGSQETKRSALQPGSSTLCCECGLSPVGQGPGFRPQQRKKVGGGERKLVDT